MSLQEALRLMRLELGMTQADLAKKVEKAFITVNRWENGRGFPTRENAKTILEIAKNGNVSQECYNYLNDMLMPDTKRGKSAAAYGFPDIDRDFLFQLADGSTNALYVIEAETYRILYANRQAERYANEYLTALGQQEGERRLAEQTDRRCFHYFANRTEPCRNCPLQEIGRNQFHDMVMTSPDTGNTVRIHAKATNMKGRKVYAIYLTDVSEKSAERNALYELTNDIPDGVGIYQVYYDGRIELAFMNEAFYRMIGPERRESMLKDGKSDLSLIDPMDRETLWAELKASIAEKRNADLTLHMQGEAGRYHAVHLQGRPIQKDTEKLTFYCLFRDLEQDQA